MISGLARPRVLSKETAIIAAFYRGYAATRASKQDLGMLAAGISAADFPNYTSDIKDAVSIVCFSSLQSITISGTIPALELLRLNLVRDKKFARLLQVNLAYQSKYMNGIGDYYDILLLAQVKAQSPGNKGIRMFSSVTGGLLEGPVFVDYWKANMTSPVFFDRAVQEMLSVDSSPDFLIEIGPSGALAGPISQIIKALPSEAASVQYTTALSRGRDAIKATFDVAGKLFIAVGTVNLSNVNQLGGEGEVAPAVIVDMPNYAWNYSTKYWYENEASKDWRYRLFPHHVLLGSKILGSSWNEPAFKKTLEVQNLPWLRDHRMGPDIVFPAAGEGYIPNGQTTFDLVVLKVSGTDEHNRQIIDNTRKLIADGGHLLVVDYDGNDEHTTTRKGQTTTPVDTNSNDIPHGNGGTSDSNSDGFKILDSTERPRTQRYSLMDRKDLTCLGARFYPSIDGNTGSIVLGRAEAIREPVSGSRVLKLQAGLVAAGWNVSQHEAPFDDIDPESIGIVVEFGDSILPTIIEFNWEAPKATISFGMKLLWVTEGSQMEVTNPSKAMIHGLGRTVRSEDPSVNLTTLDVEGVSNTATFNALITVLKRIQIPRTKVHIESEYVERGGYLHVPRILPDNVINKAEVEAVDGRPPVLQSLHSAETTIRLQCERVGTIDTIQYNEVAPIELPLGENLVEVELFAAGLNFKDVAITMGIVPENEHLLGLEGAGLIRRVHPSVTKFKPGERVLVFKKGAFANRVISTVERTYHIPDWMSYEEASTLASVYLTAMYSIKDLANTQKGHRVLIYFAIGGLGQASIQICHNIGAEIYATVGNDEKIKFLVDRYGISEDRIFSSRSTDFDIELMHATHGAGVVEILNSLTGELMEESWRCIAAGGTMVELGKKDMLDRDYLSMEPFGRNAFYRCFDMSHAHVSDTFIARPWTSSKSGSSHPLVLSQHSHLQTFLLHSGAKHIGKIVISDGPNTNIQVAARPAQKLLVLQEDVSYLIVGGLKGLCGTVATQLARHGAKHLVILSRSGCDDERSKAVLKNLKAIGCSFTLVTGDVAKKADVTRCFKEAPLPIGGIIQGAMVLRDRVFTSMTISEYYQAIEAKLQGSWNLHDVSIETGSTINFFTMLSSISGVVGQKGQANYAAANVFLDNFARYRHKQGLKACSIDLDAIDDIGYMSKHKDLLVALDTAAWTPINESLFNKILRVAILQEIAPLNAHSNGQLITSIAVPQEENSRLLADARFAGLCFGDQTSGSGGSAAAEETKEMQALLLLLKNGAPQAALMGAAIEAVNKQFMVTLRLGAPMEPGKPLSSYEMDSLAAVEFRNWARLELHVELTTLEIANANSLHALCDKIVSNMNKS
ncbi:hypothetical protein PENCOP_c003G08807 [Penicillium coprophilum]|uniref:Uncharacterized protein n=1 Tax=Penicillium coprophilum TaxID=36646 RepID=A0A1V6UYL2_9EURO|nr:hypothetical protein PENCOP_c003G08807 [Penicillium coprophilum]